MQRLTFIEVISLRFRSNCMILFRICFLMINLDKYFKHIDCTLFYNFKSNNNYINHENEKSGNETENFSC
jgi:hypothetical protein